MLLVSHDPYKTMNALSKIYRMKEGSIGKPKKYLGADVIEYQLQGDAKPKWGFHWNNISKNLLGTLN
jgi:hypothetical protein